jgi:anti-sigma regulatory factor (Ser/Thr protein kinase)
MADGDLQITFRPNLAALTEVRRELGRWLDDCGTPTAMGEELVLAADELCANAIEAAEEGMIQLVARCDGSAIHLAVSNAGHAPPDLSRPEGDDDPDAEPSLLDRGRGLTIVRAFTDSLAIVNVDGRTVARAVRLLPS